MTTPKLNFQRESARTLERLLPRLIARYPQIAEDAVFLGRLETHLPETLRLLTAIYREQYDFFYYLEEILATVAEMYVARSEELHHLDREREQHPHWFQDHQMIGGVCYVDLFAGNFDGVREQIPYFQELGLTYLHLMPLFKAPEANSDGGYAVSDYRNTDPKLGTMDQLRALATELRHNGISLVIDFVFNHTSDEHQWALRALKGEEKYQDYYFIFPDRTTPDQYEPFLREIFPEQAPGCFTYRPEIKSWVWTTFNTFQWDLNYRNPETFNAMLGEMLYLANQGVEVLRLDAVAFIWKELGTSCEGLPQVHWIIQAMNRLARIAAPGLIFKSEAIVHPREVATYIDWDECPIAYNPTYMACIWEALATREVKLLRQSMQSWFQLPDGCSWVNYVRVHDDIGWSFADEDAALVGINGFDHRQFLNQFYTGRFSGSFAMGVPFNFNPITLDMRISGTAASLAGLEQAITLDSPLLIDHAIARLLMIHGLILSAGGIPLIYLNDEIAMLNDYSYRDAPEKAQDSRWVHRPRFDWGRADQRHDPNTVPGRMFTGLQRLIEIRKAHPAFDDRSTMFFNTQNPHVLGFVRMVKWRSWRTSRNNLKWSRSRR